MLLTTCALHCPCSVRPGPAELDDSFQPGMLSELADTSPDAWSQQVQRSYEYLLEDDNPNTGLKVSHSPAFIDVFVQDANYRGIAIGQVAIARATIKELIETVILESKVWMPCWTAARNVVSSSREIPDLYKVF